MYTPSAFRVESQAKIADFIRRHSFATLVTHDDSGSFASHLPLLYHADGGNGTLIGHMARANKQWKHFENGGEVLVIFQGPHAYISPTWYESSPNVPTWNYAVVHAYGIPAVVEDPERLSAIIDETVANYEGNPLPVPADFRDKLMLAIVGFEIPISRIEAKFKLGQNRQPADLRGIYQALSRSAEEGDRALAALMLAEGNVSPSSTASP